MAYYVGDAISEIKKIKALPDGHLDFTTLPEFAKRRFLADNGQKDKHGKAVMVETRPEERDLGAMISMLTVAVQQLNERLEKVEKGT
jgi:hypothetical protein